MNVAIWPPDLPRPKRDGYQAQHADPRLKRKADSGVPNYRKRRSNVARDVALTVKLSRSEKAVFERFVEDTLDMGSKTFYMPDPTTEGWPLLDASGAPLLMHDGSPILMSARWLCLLGDEMPRETIKGVRFLISFNVWVMP